MLFLGVCIADTLHQLVNLSERLQKEVSELDRFRDAAKILQRLEDLIAFVDWKW